MPQHSSPGSFVWFSLICSRGGGLTTAAVTLDTVADEGKNNLAEGVTRSPARLCSRGGKLCYYVRLEYDFLVFFVPCFSQFIFSPSWHFCLLRVPSSVQQSAVTLSINDFCSTEQR